MKKRIILLLAVIIAAAAAGVAFYVTKDKGHEKAADVSVNTESGDEPAGFNYRYGSADKIL